MKHITADTAKGPVDLLLNQIAGYARKSTKGERAACSISEQVGGIRRLLSSRYGVALPDAQILEEAPGLGGDLYWEGGGPSWNRKGRRKRTRIKLTRLVEDIEAGRVKMIVVWDVSRLWRHTGVCADLLELFAEQGVLLADRNGLIDISTNDGRKRLKDQATALQDVRDMISENTHRALDAKRERGEAVKIGRYLGYGRRSKREVEHFPEEIQLARRMYTMLVYGELGGPPMSPLAIAKRLTEEGLGRLFPESCWEEGRTNPERFVNCDTVRKVLRSPRYIGMQWKVDEDAVVKRRLFEARDFLIGGEPAVCPDVWHEAQRILERNLRGPRRAVTGRPGCGLLRCGVCAKSYVLTKGPDRTATDGLPIPTLSAWRVRGNRTHHGCDHLPPAIGHDALLRFFRTDFAKVLKAEVRRAHSLSTAADLRNRISALRLQRETLEGYIRKTAEESIENLINGRKMLSKSMVEQAEGKIQEISASILELEDVAERSERAIESLDAFDSEDEGRMREAMRSAIVWGAVVPASAKRPRVKMASVGPKVVGHVLFLTAWRTYHTAAIEERVVEGRTRRARPVNVLRLLPSEEGLGTVNDLPSPKRFYKNVHREQGKLRTRGVFNADDWAPSYEKAETLQTFEDMVMKILG